MSSKKVIVNEEVIGDSDSEVIMVSSQSPVPIVKVKEEQETKSSNEFEDYEKALGLFSSPILLNETKDINIKECLGNYLSKQLTKSKRPPTPRSKAKRK
ncbi:hypothetical protein TVAG_321560 [Trichomonas vaginalis G3]|uniref:Uncharacterized protein n=1 Tax=Trichomonas vaginalis (strain ATCC PRA-98 / G3) TaxID=412133 RepID=A2FXY0_TRIV3|nr:hypothetical protein TVAGG3_0405160 [Trichomonas vaginalis G3]EAX90235.1 hypothetical protein TVAG_321560 [Trichomonas vaginalis G3]KAI5534980.1 hypothetical protein TVAGG3_0405160 [Trichomonas vaginalis G3]|eukprot:XP_001303165.1 hypothetical protein [Trichomonas vaginalis G3]